MSTLKNKNGTSLVELLVGILVSSILILTIGVLSETANRSYNKLYIQQQIYNDISYGLKMLQNKVRIGGTLVAGNKSAPWVSGQHFLIGSGAFGLYQTSGTVKDLVYDNGVTRETLFSVPQPGTITLAFPVTLTSKSVTIQISGTKNNIPFDILATATRRN